MFIVSRRSYIVLLTRTAEERSGPRKNVHEEEKKIYNNQNRPLVRVLSKKN